MFMGLVCMPWKCNENIWSDERRLLKAHKAGHCILSIGCHPLSNYDLIHAYANINIDLLSNPYTYLCMKCMWKYVYIIEYAPNWFSFIFIVLRCRLVAVAVAFFLCWAPFHAQRLMAVYGKTSRPQSYIFRSIYTALTYISGVLYFMSTCINPLLYSILSHKFRNAFKVIRTSVHVR